MKKYYALDNDLYKFTMQQAAHHNYPGAYVRYLFKLRNPHIMFGIDLDAFYKAYTEEVRRFCDTRFEDDELDYLESIPFFTSDYIDFLEDFTFKDRFLNISKSPDGIALEIEGPWVQTILFEVPLLSIFTETLHQMKLGQGAGSRWRDILNQKTSFLFSHMFAGNKYKIAEFGTRRRASYYIQEEVIKHFLYSIPQNLVGTSNVHLAMKYGIKSIGTMAHEWLQAHQALYRVSDSQKMALETWAHEYKGDLGIALSDVVGFDAFLRDFDKYFSKLFDGCRHDSGDPIEWGDKLVKHYKKLGIDPRTKFAVFSDGLNFEKMVEVYRHFDGQINTSFGIGTYLTNDCGYEAPQVVIKMVECNGKPVAKISDSKGKGMCEDESYLKYLKEQFQIKE